MGACLYCAPWEALEPGPLGDLCPEHQAEWEASEQGKACLEIAEALRREDDRRTSEAWGLIGGREKP